MTHNKKKILVIEDDADVLSMLEDFLSYLGYEVTSASDGLEGLKKVKSGIYDLVITDVAMPYISGVGIISMLKKEFPKVPVIAITGYGYYAEEVAHEKQADKIMSKPFDIKELQATVEKLLS